MGKSGWRFLVCDCGSPMAKPNLCYEVWNCPACGRQDSWGDSSQVVPVARGGEVMYQKWRIFICRTEPADYRHTVTVQECG